jgi:signal transduction histidine kinase
MSEKHFGAILLHKTEDKNLFTRLQRKNQEQETIITFTRDLRLAQTASEVQLILLKKMSDIFNFDAAAFIVNHKGPFEVGSCEGKWKTGVEICIVGNEDFFSSLLAAKHPLYIESREKLGKIIKPLFPSASSVLPYLIIGVPVAIHGGEAPFGLLLLGDYSGNPAFKEEMNLLLSIVEIAAINIQRQKTKEMNEQLVSRRTNELTALYNVISTAGKSIGLQERLDMALGEVLQSLDCHQGAIFLHDQDNHQLTLVANRCMSEFKENTTSIPIDGTREGWVLSHEEVLIIPDITVDQSTISQIEPHLDQQQIYIGMPIKTRGKTTGVLSVCRSGKEIFDIEEITFISALANHIGVIIENNYLIEQIEKATLLEERSRLARELHDSVTQTLYSASFFAEAGLDMAELGNLAQVKENLARLSQISQQALKEMRLLIYQLRPEILESDGLFPAIRQRLDLVENKVGIQARFTTNIISRLSRALEDALYWISVEALNNVVKHAHADTIELNIFVKENWVRLNILDNGIGFDINHPSNSSGMGISNIRERVKKIGGLMEIKSVIHQGTCLTVSCPIDEETSKSLEIDE